jgi:hypothetical protein
MTWDRNLYVEVQRIFNPAVFHGMQRYWKSSFLKHPRTPPSILR